MVATKCLCILPQALALVGPSHTQAFLVTSVDLLTMRV